MTSIKYRNIFIIQTLILLWLHSGFSFGQEKLFNGKDLTGWDTYLGPETTDSNGVQSKPLGLNNDQRNVFTVVEIDGKPAIRISGEIGGGLSTKEEFSNYHLTLQFKWGSKDWWPARKKKDSGLLYHAVGLHGADYGFWMRSQEFQIQEGDCGDYWGVAGGGSDVKSKRNQNGDYIYDDKGELHSFNATSGAGRRCKKNPDNEKPTGEWNTLELYSFGGSSVHIVNSVVVMELSNSVQIDGGKTIPLTKGKIQLQSEGAEIFFRNIVIEPIDKIPAGIND